jgi:hypothetical protein
MSPCPEPIDSAPRIHRDGCENGRLGFVGGVNQIFFPAVWSVEQEQ